MSRALVSLLAVALAGTAFAQSSTPLEALEMDVLNPGEKPEQALERMAAKHKSDEDSDAGATDGRTLDVRPVAAETTRSFGSSPLPKEEPREILPGNSDRAHEKRSRDHRHDKDRDDRDDDDDDGKSREVAREDKRDRDSERKGRSKDRDRDNDRDDDGDRDD